MRLMVKVLAAVAPGTAAVAVGALAAGAVPPGKDGSIAYSNAVNGDATHIFVTNPAGSAVADLTPGWEDEATDPAWSPNMRQIAFVSDRGNEDSHTFVWIINADGSGARELGGGGIEQSAPAWSPDGKRIAFSRCSHYQDGDGVCSSAQIATIGANGKGLKLVTRPLRTSATDSQPAFSPDGKQLVFQRTVDFGNVTVWTAEIGGTNLRRIVSDDSPVDHSPSFSPNGKQIAYVSDATGPETIYLASPNGKNRKKVIDEESAAIAAGPDEDGIDQGGGGAENPAFAPSGKRIVFMANGDLWTVALDGTGAVQVTQDGGDEPDWGRGP